MTSRSDMKDDKEQPADAQAKLPKLIAELREAAFDAGRYADGEHVPAPYAFRLANATRALVNGVTHDDTSVQAWRDVIAERQRQISSEGWALEHDDEHGEGELALAAACYAHLAGDQQWCHPEEIHSYAPDYWPWGAEWWKPKDSRSNLVRAAALLLAEIERLDRAAAKGGANAAAA